jgi:hypothetical protein
VNLTGCSSAREVNEESLQGRFTREVNEGRK